METANLIYTCYDGKQRTKENLVPDHTLTMIVAGTSHAYFNGGDMVTQEGGFRFIARNTLAKFTKHPSPGTGYKVLSVVFDIPALREYSRQLNIKARIAVAGGIIRNLPATALLKSYFHSLTPYLDSEPVRFKQLNKIKVMEAISILLDLDPSFADILFDFDESGKLDLEKYMQDNFRYDLSLEEFARLTGRSLSAFKRDFAGIFGTTPYEWLKTRRLQEAYFLLTHERQSAAEAAFLAGFTNYSHFSRLFKARFGKSPSDALTTP